MNIRFPRQAIVFLAGLLVLAGILTATPRQAAAANPAPVQIFYLSEPEDSMLSLMKTINSAAKSPMVTKISISISQTGTIVYYDHWENGYVNDIANPSPSEIYSGSNTAGVQIWGDGDASNGCAPAIRNVPVVCNNTNDVLKAGDVIILGDNNIVVPRVTTAINWDGKDKIGATHAVAVSRSLWASGSNSLFAWGMALFPVSDWGTSYTAPVGCDTSDSSGMFEYTALSIMAAYDNTQIQVAPSKTDSFGPTITLQQGQAHLAESSTGGSCSYIKEGARVKSLDPAKPIQVVLVTGDIGSSYASRDLNLFPDESLSSSYWIPVGHSKTGYITDNSARVWLYNPESTTMYIRCEKPGSADNVYTLSARSVNKEFNLTENQGGHCYAVKGTSGSDRTTPDPTRKFTGLLTIDTYGASWDWALAFIPDDFLTNRALVGLGVGRDWTATELPDANGSPIWVMPTCQTYFYVDWNNDGNPDKVDFNGDGDVDDTNINGLNETTSNKGFQVNALQSVRLFNPTRDQTGAFIYTKTANNNQGEGGCSFAAAWGEDPASITSSRPGLDLGTLVVPMRAVEASKGSNLLVDADQNGILSPGDTIQYVISVTNTGFAPALVSVYDEVPNYVTYVLNSTEKHLGTGWTSIPDSGSGTKFPLDDNPPNGVALGSLPVGATWQVRFKATINDLPAGTWVDIQNCARVAYDGQSVVTCVTDKTGVPRITVKKVVTGTGAPAGVQFGFQSSWGDFKLVNGETNVSGPLVAGRTYSVSENMPLLPGWALTTATCDDLNTPDVEEAIDPSAIIPTGGNDYLCTFTNHYTPGQITVKKVVTGANAPAGVEFEFDPTWSTTNFKLKDGESHSSGPLASGNYKILEVTPLPPGWALKSASCDNLATPGVVETIDPTTTNIPLTGSGNWICVFTNEYTAGQITVKKVVTGANAPAGAEFEFDPSWSTNNFKLKHNGTQNSGPLAAGVYNVSEVTPLPAGFALDSATCDNLATAATETVAPSSIPVTGGDNWLCTFTNKYTAGQITVKKVVTGANAPAGAEFEFDPSWSTNNFKLKHNETQNSGPLAAGTYNVSEVTPLPAGFALDSATCDNLATAATETVAPSSIPVTGGDNWLCTFTNKYTAGQITVKKVVTGANAPAGVEFEFNPSWSATHFKLKDGETKASGMLVPGTYNVSEVTPLPAGWALDSATCDNRATQAVEAIPPSSIPVAGGDDWLCTFTNKYTAGQITVKKVVTGANAPAGVEFEFDPSWSKTHFKLKDGETKGSGMLVAGTYSVSEVTPLPAGFALDSATCDNRATQAVETTPPSSIPVAGGDDWLCTFTNKYTAGHHGHQDGQPEHGTRDRR